MSTTAAPPQPASPVRPVIPRGVAALIGVLAVAAALAVGHLVAALVSPASSPYLAVGDTVIRFSPEWLTEFAKTTFGTADKPILLGGMARRHRRAGGAGGARVAAPADPGRRGRRRARACSAWSPCSSRRRSPRSTWSPRRPRWRRASSCSGSLHAQALRAVLRAGRTPGSAVSRAAACWSAPARRSASERSPRAAAGSLLGGGIGDSRRRSPTASPAARLAETAPPIPAGAAFPESGTLPFLTSNADFYRVDVALRIPTQSAADWRLRIHGMVDREVTLTFDDLLARPLVERTITLTCVSNEVGGPYISTANFIGVDLRDILLGGGRHAGRRPGDQHQHRRLDRGHADRRASWSRTGVRCSPSG